MLSPQSAISPPSWPRKVDPEKQRLPSLLLLLVQLLALHLLAGAGGLGPLAPVGALSMLPPKLKLAFNRPHANLSSLPGGHELRPEQSASGTTNTNSNSNTRINTYSSSTSTSTSNNKRRRPNSSSSAFAEIEDLSDSSVRTRGPNGRSQALSWPVLFGGEPAPNAEHLGDSPSDFDALVGRLEAAAGQQQAARPASGAGAAVSGDANNRTSMRFFRNNKTFASIVYTNGEPPPSAPAAPNAGNSSQPRRLINCHLVDLEKHEPDVALFESKYDIRTVDVEFKDMMQIIEACTNIARFKPLRAAARLAAPAASRPLLVVGRPAGAALVQPMQPLPMGAAKQQPVQQPVQQQRRVRRQRPAKQPPPPPPPPAAKQRLVLGEVTPPPSAVQGKQGGIKEALQEISSYDSSDLMAIWRGILPGTNWCGMGDRASSYNDLGFESDIDICCRAHDFCPIRLAAFSSGYGLFNWSFYTRSHCWCDQNFLDCLQRADSPLSVVVLKFYFNIMKTTCLHDNETLAPGQAAQRAALSAGQQPEEGGAGRARQRLLDHIRASLPIPALKQSLRLRSKVESKPPVGQRPYK